MTVLDLEGRLTFTAASEMGRRIQALLVAGATHLVLNLEDVSYIDSAGLGAMVEASSMSVWISGPVTPRMFRVVQDLSNRTRGTGVSSEKDDDTGNQKNCETNLNQHKASFRRNETHTLEQPNRRQDDADNQGDRHADSQDGDGDGEHHQRNAHKIADVPYNPHTLSMRRPPEARCRKQHTVGGSDRLIRRVAHAPARAWKPN